MKINARELEGAALDWAVAVATGHGLYIEKLKAGDAWCGVVTVDNAIAPFLACAVGHKIGRSKRPYVTHYFYPSTVWSEGGPLIEQHHIQLHTHTGDQHGEHERWYAVCPTEGGSRGAMGPTPLVAAMRALVFAQLGEWVEIPDELAAA